MQNLSMFGKEQLKYQLGFCFFPLGNVEVKFYQEAKLPQEVAKDAVFWTAKKVFSNSIVKLFDWKENEDMKLVTLTYGTFKHEFEWLGFWVTKSFSFKYFPLLQPQRPAGVSHVPRQRHWAAVPAALLPAALPEQNSGGACSSSSELHYPAGRAPRSPCSVPGHDVHLAGGRPVQLLHVWNHAQLHSLQETGKLAWSVPPVHRPRLDQGDDSVQGRGPSSTGEWRGQMQGSRGHLQPCSQRFQIGMTRSANQMLFGIWDKLLQHEDV